VNREGCTAKDFFKFTCPDNKETKFAHPRFSDPEGKAVHVSFAVPVDKFLV